MPPLIQRLVYGWVIIFVASVTMTGGLLVYSNDSILLPKWRAIVGLLFLFGAAVAIFAAKNRSVLGLGAAAGFLLVIVSLFFEWAHPVYRYAAVRRVDPDGYVKSDEIYLRSAPVVRMLENDGARKSQNGGWFGIERYLYSPRIGMVLGKSLGEGTGSPEFGYEISGFAAWLFGIRAACEEFSFFVINLTPALLIYGLYCRYRKKPQRQSLTLQPARALFLAGPFCLGLTPLIGA